MVLLPTLGRPTMPTSSAIRCGSIYRLRTDATWSGRLGVFPERKARARCARRPCMRDTGTHVLASDFAIHRGGNALDGGHHLGELPWREGLGAVCHRVLRVGVDFDDEPIRTGRNGRPG